MAVAASPINQVHQPPHLYLVGERQVPQMPYIDSDTIPELAAARLQAGNQADTLLHTHQERVEQGQAGEVPLAVDPLSSASRVRQAEARHGTGSQEHEGARLVLRTDSLRLLGEAYRKLTWEYFAPLRQEYDAAIADYAYGGRPLSLMVADGITPMPMDEEQGYRRAELVEEHTYGALRRLGKLAVGNLVVLRPAQPTAGVAPEALLQPRPQLTVTTISPCAKWAIQGLANGQTEFGGYVPERQKIAVRTVHFATDEDARYMEQAYVPGEYITDQVIDDARQLLAGVSADKSARTTQLIGWKGEGVLHMIALLDSLASQRSGLNIFMGEVVPEGTIKDYDAVPEEAQARQAQLEDGADDLMDYVLDLENHGVDHSAAGGLVREYAKQILFAKVKNNPDQAAIVFNQQTAERLRSADSVRLVNPELAIRLEQLAEEQAPPPSYCMAGSCGLESIPQTSTAAAEANKLGLKGSILRDTVRGCPGCGQRTVVYSLSSKACLNCKIIDVISGPKKTPASKT